MGTLRTEVPPDARSHTHSPAHAHAHLLTCTASRSCTDIHHSLVPTHIHTGVQPHAHWHARTCTHTIRTLARTHTHTHPFAHRRAPLTASVAFRGGGKGRVPPGVHTCGRPFACPLPHGGPPVPAPGRTSACDSVSHPLFPGHPAQCLAGAGPPRVPASEVERGRAQGPAWGGEGHVEGGLSGGGAALRDGVLGVPSPAAPGPRQAALLRPDSAAPTGRDSAPPSHKRPCR